MDDLSYTDDWVDAATNLDNFTNEARLLPAQVGNEGALDQRPTVAATPVVATGPAGTMPMPMVLAQPQPLWQPQPMQQPASVINEKGLVDMNALLRSSPALAAMAGPVGGYGAYGAGMYTQPTGPAALRAGGASWMNPLNQFANNRNF